MKRGGRAAGLRRIGYCIVSAGAAMGALSLAAAPPALAADPPLTVNVASCPGRTVTGFAGNYQGGAAGSMRQFLAIPYAAPPTGANRWQPPKTTCWNGNKVLPTFNYISCPQGTGSFSNEDCLVLNIFTQPTGAVSNLPVMVFIHGGGLTSGAGTFQLNPLNLVNKGVIVVTINYRLGAFGFLAHPALDKVAAKRTGNYGILDQQAALKWVKTNINAFGGDPKNVTIFGGSAGGLSVLVHLLSPLSTGLFQKAIVQSGSIYDAPTPLATAASQGTAFAASVGCPGSGAAAASCLRSRTVSAILANQGSLGQSTTLLKIDGVVLTDTIKNLLLAGKFQKTIPVINGSNHDEMRFHLVGDARIGTGDSCHFHSNLGPGNYHSTLQQFYGGSFVSQIEALYPDGGSAFSANANFSAARGDNAFICRALHVDNWLAQKGSKVYAYEFNDTTAPNTGTGPVKLSDNTNFSLGAYHGAEGQYIFPASSPAGCNLPYPGLNATQKKLATAMVTYWTTFAKTGNPNPTTGTKPPLWPLYTGPASNLMSMVGGKPVKLKASSFDSDHKCSSFWDINVP